MRWDPLKRELEPITACTIFWGNLYGGCCWADVNKLLCVLLWLDEL